LKPQSNIQIKPGVTSLITEMLSYGTALNNEETIANIKDTNNISASVDVSADTIAVGGNFAKENAGLAYKLMKENLLYPNFNKENLQRAKDQIKLVYMSMPKSPSSKAVEELFPDDPSGISLRQEVENIDNITLEDVTSTYSVMLANSNAKAVITGDFESGNELYNQTNFELGQGLPMFNPIETKPADSNFQLASNKVILESEARNQADVVQMYRIDETGNIKDKAAILLLNEILGGNSQSRLFTDLRESQKLAYRVKSSYTSSNNKGALELQILTTTENSLNPNQSQNLKKSLDGFKKHINKLITEPVSINEIESAKIKIKSDIMFASESINGKNALLSSSLSTLYCKKYIEEMFTTLDNTKPEDIQKIAYHYLKKPSVTSVIASKNTIQSNKNYLKTLGELKEIN
jgi:predicted Zn-dependent peptidase